ncbi:MAG: outer membrane beta-barrel protein [Leadbetterella sp.]
MKNIYILILIFSIFTKCIWAQTKPTQSKPAAKTTPAKPGTSSNTNPKKTTTTPAKPAAKPSPSTGSKTQNSTKPVNKPSPTAQQKKATSVTKVAPKTQTQVNSSKPVPSKTQQTEQSENKNTVNSTSSNNEEAPKKPMYKPNSELPTANTNLLQKRVVDKKPKRSKRTHFIGLKGGINLNTMSTDLDISNYIGSPNSSVTQIGYASGLVFDFSVGKKLSLQTEVLYSQLGYKKISSNTNESYNEKYRGFMLPVLGKYDIVSKENMTLGLFTGPYFMYYGSKNIYFQNPETGSFKQNIVYSKSYDSFGTKESRYDYGMIAGVQVSKTVSVARIFIEGRYIYGLKNSLSFEEQVSPELKYSQKNRSISLSVGLVYPIFK